MPLAEIIFWITIMVLVFIVLLGLQLRYFAGVALRLAVGEKLKAATREEVSAIILSAVGGGRTPHVESAAHQAEVEALRTNYAPALRQIRIGRRITMIVPFLIAALAVAFRFLPGWV